YCRFTIEDFTGTYNFSLFGKDYMQFKTYVETPNAMLHISGRYAQRWNNENEFEFKISKIDLLSDVRTKLTKSLTLELSSLEVTDKLIEELDTTLSKFPGKTKLRFKFIDAEENIAVGVNATQRSIELNNDLLKELDQLRIGYNLN
ncbi:MAG TPA: hypothetical protein VK154_01495, partial [Chitinophagales bacterium]|nr:hypothetical protein [Chitinophagales bacterium]